MDQTLDKTIFGYLTNLQKMIRPQDLIKKQKLKINEITTNNLRMILMVKKACIIR